MHLQDQDRTTCGLTHSVVRVDHVKISCPRKQVAMGRASTARRQVGAPHDAT